MRRAARRVVAWWWPIQGCSAGRCFGVVAAKLGVPLPESVEGCLVVLEVATADGDGFLEWVAVHVVQEQPCSVQRLGSAAGVRSAVGVVGPVRRRCG